MDGASLSVRLPQFEGPLDLLLQLIERRELEITAISLATVADQYLAAVASLEGLAAEALADFVALAARLVLIKSRALLPRPAPPTEEEADDGEELARQLAAYRQARATALALAERQAAGLRAHARPPAPAPARAERPLAPLGAEDLARAVRRRLLALPPTPVPLALAPVVSLPERIAAIEASLARDGLTRLTSLLEMVSDRATTIVTFVALLELIRRRRIEVRQALLFGEIEIVPLVEEGDDG